MFKKILILSAISILATNIAQAEHSFYKSGFHFGVHLGGSFGKGKFDTVYEDGVVLTPSLPSSATAKTSTFLAGLSGGYLWVFHNDVTLGANVVVNVFNQKMIANLEHSEFEAFRNAIKRNYSIMPSINLGKVFARRYHVYLGLGMSISRFDIEVFNYVDAKSTATVRTTKVAFMPSVGLDYALNHRVALSANISYEIFPNLSHRFGKELLPEVANPDPWYDTKNQPRFITTRISVTYKFYKFTFC